MSWRANDGSLPLRSSASFLLLGCSSFGGPTAHLGYFRERFVERERWLTDAAMPI